jgi:hypothetical protein
VRVFHTTPSATALQILRTGFSDAQVSTHGLDIAPEHAFVLLSESPLDINEGVEGDTVLSLEIPDEVFAKHEYVEEGSSYRYALVPLEIVRSFGIPAVHDHDYAMSSRRDLVAAANRWEAVGRPEHAAEMREAIRFFDEVGWRSIVALQEGQPPQG